MAYRRILLAFLFFIIVAPCISAAEYPYRVFWETQLATADQSWVPGSFIISPDGIHFAYIKNDQGHQKVVHDGSEHNSHEEVINLCFTPDSKHLAYIAKRGNEFFLVFDGIEGKGYASIISESLSFSPDSKHYAFVGQSGNKWVVVTEKGEGKTYDEIGAGLLRYSPDSQSLVYPARVGAQWMVVINGQESKAYDGIRTLIYSPDSKRMAAVVRMGSTYAVVVDNQVGPAFSMVKPGSLVFSPDSERFGYIASDQGQEFIVVNHQVGKAYDRIISEQITFSPVGNKIAFAAQIQEKQMIVVDGVEGKTYAALMEAPPVFSPDGRKMAYAAFNGANWVVVLDGVEQTGYSSIGKGSIIFSKRGRLAYTAKTAANKWTVVVDGFGGRYYDAIGENSLSFSPDGKNVVYSAKQGAKWMVVLDDGEGRLFDAIVTSGERMIRFNGSAFFDYSALDGRKIVTIRERIASKSDFKDSNLLSDGTEFEKQTDLPVQEFQFRFNPPAGLYFIQTTKIVDSVEAEFMSQQLHEEEIEMGTEILPSSSGFQINHSILKYLVKDVEDQAGGAALSVLEGVKFSIFLDEKGYIIGFKGLEDFDKKLKTMPPVHYRKYKDLYTKKALEKSLRDSWKASVEDFIGKSFQLGDVWQTTAKVPLPNGENCDVAADILFKEATAVRSIPCVVIQTDYDLNSSSLKKFIVDMINKGAPRLQTDPEVNISGMGESVVDPETLLGHSSRMEMVMETLVDLPTLGKKELTFKRLIEVNYDYSN